MTPVLGKLGRRDLPAAARLLGRGMRDNPINLRAIRIASDTRRERALARFFLPALRGLSARGEVLGAFDDGALVGVCGIAPPSRCQPTVVEKLCIAPSVLFGHSPATAIRVAAWTGAWAKADPAEAHWHLGPVAVDASLRGQGIGGFMLKEFCTRMDARNELAYLETDKPENVRFYQRFGFQVTGECRVLGVPNWFMSRPCKNRAHDVYGTKFRTSVRWPAIAAAAAIAGLTRCVRPPRP
jgi:ribosomal protein S18 acetylase RimI-like enzyme